MNIKFIIFLLIAIFIIVLIKVNTLIQLLIPISSIADKGTGLLGQLGLRNHIKQ